MMYDFKPRVNRNKWLKKDSHPVLMAFAIVFVLMILLYCHNISFQEEQEMINRGIKGVIG